MRKLILTPKSCSRKHRGSILITTLYILSFLTVITLSLAHYTHVSIKLTRRYLDKFESRNIAEGVIALIRSELAEDKSFNDFDHDRETWLLKYVRSNSLEKMDFTDTKGNTMGTYTARITDESGKLNINTADYASWVKFLNNFKNVSSDKLARRILTFRDQNETKRFYSIYDLLEIPDFPSDLFCKDDQNSDERIEDLVTIFSKGMVNINTAPWEVLTCLPGMNKSIADSLIDARAKKPFESIEEIQELPLVTDPIFDEIASWATVGSDYFHVIVSARGQNERSGITVSTIIDRSEDVPRIRYWRED